MTSLKAKIASRRTGERARRTYSQINAAIYRSTALPRCAEGSRHLAENAALKSIVGYLLSASCGMAALLLIDDRRAKEVSMRRKTVIVTGASQGIGAAVVRAFIDGGYNVLATSRSISTTLAPSPNLAVVGGDIGQSATAEKVTQTAISEFGSIDHVVNNAGIFAVKPFIDYTAEDFRQFVSTNLEGFIFVTQLAVKRMLAQGTGGSVTTITASLAESPMADTPASIPMITKGGLNAVTRSLAIEYAKKNIRFNAVAPGIVDTPLHSGNSRDFLKTRSPMGIISSPKDIADAVLYLAGADHVTGDVLYVDGGAHAGRW
jgi:NAD(P)-dependent dehydrogenase (short-subunit alcohol dehydrogenase family)